LENGFGPYDYRVVDSHNKWLVESAHFPPQVETLRAGSRGTIGGDLDYTLRALPNHPRALMAMVRLSERLKTPQPPGARYPAECYFDRAVRFSPDDAMVHVLYGNYLAKRGRAAEARQQLAAAEANVGTDAQVTYNLGLAYFELKDYEKAAGFAKNAQEMGIQFTGLQQRLERVGKWPR
jgi:Tfp pilus assembly protein PilF